ncbi:hypothetical protein [Nocardia jejuensis]|uniref:hypothetical protein n=1 Tax=Nocardia jejuensis TaxID=328049 RepID=UPI000A004ACE|nr:hypothetical protein [Nocardia jejuensis]
MDGSNAGAAERDAPLRHRLPTPVAGAAAAVGAVSLGLILLGACGLGGQDTYVAPPPMNADLQAAPETTQSGTTTPGIIIPPSPTWRVAVDQPPRRTPITGVSTSPDDPDASSTTSRVSSTRPSHTTTSRTTTAETTRTTTEPAPTTTESVPTTVAPTTGRPAAALEDDDE